MKILKITVLLMLSMLFIQCQGDNAPSTLTADGELNWMKIESAIALENAKKPFLVDVYTDWCGWCKKMDKETFKDEKVKQYLADNFHVVKFNAEQKEPINFRGENFTFTKSGRRGSNGFAAKLLNGRLSYPSIVFLDKDLNPIKVNPGYKNPAQMLGELEAVVRSLN